MIFANEIDLYRTQHYAIESLKRGVFFHPHPNWFLCAAHGPADIEQTLDVACDAFACINRALGY